MQLSAPKAKFILFIDTSFEYLYKYGLDYHDTISNNSKRLHVFKFDYRVTSFNNGPSAHIFGMDCHDTASNNGPRFDVLGLDGEVLCVRVALQSTKLDHLP